MSKQAATKASFTALLVLIPSIALALDMEFYVWGGHDAVVNAFTKLSLIFGDNAYKSLYFVVITAGLFFGGVTVFAKTLGTANGSVMTWLVPTLIGVTSYVNSSGSVLRWRSPVWNSQTCCSLAALAGVIWLTGDQRSPRQERP